MSQLKATPGPWVARESDGQWVVARDRGDVLVASCGLAGAGYLTPAADAHLIAAAPDLLDAAELGLEWAIDAANECSLPKDEAVFENAMRDVRRIEAALAKARGEQA